MEHAPREKNDEPQRRFPNEAEWARDPWQVAAAHDARLIDGPSTTSHAQRAAVPAELGDGCLHEPNAVGFAAEPQQEVKVERPAKRLVKSSKPIDVDASQQRAGLRNELRAEKHEGGGETPTSIHPELVPVYVDVAAAPVHSGGTASIKFADDPFDGARGKPVVVAEPRDVPDVVRKCSQASVDRRGKPATRIVDDVINRRAESLIECDVARRDDRDVHSACCPDRRDGLRDELGSAPQGRDDDADVDRLIVVGPVGHLVRVRHRAMLNAVIPSYTHRLKFGHRPPEIH